MVRTTEGALVLCRTTNRVPRVQQVIIKYIQDLTALVRLVQLVRGHERAGSGGTAGTPGLRASTGGRRHLGQTIGRTLAMPRATPYSHAQQVAVPGYGYQLSEGALIGI